MAKKILVVFCHPLLEKSRANQILIQAYRSAGNCTFHDLYEEYPGFDVDIQREQALLLEHDLVIWHHPVFWYSCPPLMKQWIDMVLTVGWAYGPGGNALQDKKLIQVLTTGGTESMYQPDGSHRYTIREFLRPFEQTASLCNMQYLPPFIVHGTHRLGADVLTQYRDSLQQLLQVLATAESTHTPWDHYPTMQAFLSEKTTTL